MFDQPVHAVLLERMKPDTRCGIYQTMVSTTPSYPLEANLTAPPRVSRNRYQGLIDDCASRGHSS